MVYRRKGRPGYTFQARTQTGWEQLGTGADNKSLAIRIETMWETLASEHRAWDILQPILDAGRLRSKRLASLYDQWTQCKFDVTALRRGLNDVDLTPMVADFLEVYQRDVAQNTLDYATAYLRFLLPEDAPCPLSRVNEAWLTERLYAYPAKANTLRIVHSTWSKFFQYLVMPKRVFAANPMAHVPKPGLVKSRPRFHELDVVQKIIDAQPTEERRVLFALVYGSGIEISTVVGNPPDEPALTRNDFNEKTHEVRAAGTKAHTRDRMALIADWAWPRVHAYLKQHLPHAPLFTRNRSTVSHWHLETERDLKVPEYPLHNARHHWAVRQLRAGTPIEVVQRQLGHSTAKMTLDTYGVFMPNAADRAHWEREATKHDAARREAMQ